MSCSKCFFDTKKIVLFSSSSKVVGIWGKIPSAQWQGMSDSTARSNSANFDKICPIFHAARQIFPHLQMSFPDHTGCHLTPVDVGVMRPLMIYHKIFTDFCAITLGQMLVAVLTLMSSQRGPLIRHKSLVGLQI